MQFRLSPFSDAVMTLARFLHRFFKQLYVFPCDEFRLGLNRHHFLPTKFSPPSFRLEPALGDHRAVSAIIALGICFFPPSSSLLESCANFSLTFRPYLFRLARPTFFSIHLSLDPYHDGP